MQHFYVGILPVYFPRFFDAVSTFFERFFERKERRLFVWAIVLGILLHYTFQVAGNEAAIYVTIVMYVMFPYLLGVGVVAIVLWKLTRWQWLKQACLWLGRLITLAILYTVGTFVVTIFTPDGSWQLMSNCEKIFPQLESYHQKTGSYPPDLETLEKSEPLPNDFEIENCPYVQSGDTFGVVINRFWGQYAYYDRERQTWE
ncbi:MAG: hypothetical protein AAFQ63_07790 [Cyanobacteria bacterium J06621_11]